MARWSISLLSALVCVATLALASVAAVHEDQVRGQVLELRRDLLRSSSVGAGSEWKTARRARAFSSSSSNLNCFSGKVYGVTINTVEEGGICLLATDSFCYPQYSESTPEDACQSGTSCTYHADGSECTEEKILEELKTKYLGGRSDVTKDEVYKAVMQMFRDGVCTCS